MRLLKRWELNLHKFVFQEWDGNKENDTPTLINANNVLYSTIKSNPIGIEYRQMFQSTSEDKRFGLAYNLKYPNNVNVYIITDSELLLKITITFNNKLMNYSNFNKDLASMLSIIMKCDKRYEQARVDHSLRMANFLPGSLSHDYIRRD